MTQIQKSIRNKFTTIFLFFLNIKQILDNCTKDKS